MKPLSEFVKGLWVSVIIIVCGCSGDPPAPEFPVGTVPGYRPIYITYEESEIAFVQSGHSRIQEKSTSFQNIFLSANDTKAYTFMITPIHPTLFLWVL